MLTTCLVVVLHCC